jgi:hypothetical protein
MCTSSFNSMKRFNCWPGGFNTHSYCTTTTTQNRPIFLYDNSVLYYLSVALSSAVNEFKSMYSSVQFRNTVAHDPSIDQLDTVHLRLLQSVISWCDRCHELTPAGRSLLSADPIIATKLFHTSTIRAPIRTRFTFYVSVTCPYLVMSPMSLKPSSCSTHQFFPVLRSKQHYRVRFQSPN